MLGAQTPCLDRGADRLIPDLLDLQRGQDGSKSRELELITDRTQNLSARRDAFERMRDAADWFAFHTFPSPARASPVTGFLIPPRPVSVTPQTPPPAPPPPSAPSLRLQSTLHLVQSRSDSATAGDDADRRHARASRFRSRRASFTDTPTSSVHPSSTPCLAPTSLHPLGSPAATPFTSPSWALASHHHRCR